MPLTYADLSVVDPACDKLRSCWVDFAAELTKLNMAHLSRYVHISLN